MAFASRAAGDGGAWDLTALLNAAAHPGHLAQRHLWLIRLLQWLRRAPAVPDVAHGKAPLPATRLKHLLNVLAQHPEHRQNVQALLRAFWHDIDATALLADFGFSPRMSLRSELWLRIGDKLLPATPETRDLGTLFPLLFDADDDHWIESIDDATLTRVADLIWPDDLAAQSRDVLLGAMLSLGSAIAAAGLSGPLRRRMDAPLVADGPFHQLGASIERLRQATMHDQHAEALQEATYVRALLDTCRRATDSVREHLDEFGVSVDIVFECDHLRERTLRLEALLDVAVSPHRAHEVKRLTVTLLRSVLQQRGLRALIQRHTHQLARRVVERNAEAGEHYITRTRREYGRMLARAAGGGLVVAGTTMVKFALGALLLLPFWEGVANGVNYAASFVAIMLLHWTLATKQPAMTAPALAAKLSHATSTEGLNDFVDAVAQLIRSQVAGVLGNLLAVVPAVLLVQTVSHALTGTPWIGVGATSHTLHSLHLWGPTLLFAAFTGVLLFLSSMIAGWAENWFVFRQLDSAIAWNPRIVASLGDARAQRWARWWRANVSGLAGNISLGLMLGLVPVLLNFVGLGLDVRHVTLSTGMVAASAGARGWSVLDDPYFGWALASLPLIGVLNLAVSFWLAFTLALRAGGHRGSDRQRIYRAIRARVFAAPASFLWPPKGR